jgi:hypothetical protein
VGGPQQQTGGDWLWPTNRLLTRFKRLGYLAHWPTGLRLSARHCQAPLPAVLTLRFLHLNWDVGLSMVLDKPTGSQ